MPSARPARPILRARSAEGWLLVPDRYDDGGISGATLERPALKRLLTDIEAHRVDVVVVYKIDRLSRALMDFAKLVEVFDRNNVTFVSVTQSFNTTTSMGRLTLNILLSFAQFEREVIGERIRDKFAASRRKGMWMGGWAPLGYDVKDRKLIVNEREAKLVRSIFTRFARGTPPQQLIEMLAKEGTLNKRGKPIDKGYLYRVLNNRVCLGEAVHKGSAYPGEHDPIVEKDLWEQVHELISASPRKRTKRPLGRTPAILKGTPVIIAFPVSNNVDLHLSNPGKALRRTHNALFIDTHSRLVSWWLVNAWRSQQLAAATWSLGDSMQIIPAAACARSLLETAASFWVETKYLQEIWSETKRDCAETGITYEHWHRLTSQVYKMVWGAKFDNKVPDLAKTYQIPRPNVLTLIEKLGRATENPVQQDYQWLCNAVHPSIGGMLAFASPLLVHTTKASAFQWICAAPIHVDTAGQIIRVTTIQEALARASALAVDVLVKTLDDALKIIDDIGLTTKAPTMASFDYWRNIAQKKGDALCPCRSGRTARNCLHRWTDATPTVAERF